jgi:hypothetical protein
MISKNNAIKLNQARFVKLIFKVEKWKSGKEVSKVKNE